VTHCCSVSRVYQSTTNATATPQASGIGAISPLIVGLMNQLWHSSTTDPEAYDPTYSLLIMVPGMYLLSAIVFGSTGVVYRKARASYEESNPFGLPSYVLAYISH
jgi:hypothetical protein